MASFTRFRSPVLPLLLSLLFPLLLLSPPPGAHAISLKKKYDGAAETSNIVNALKRAGKYSTLLNAIQDSGLASLLPSVLSRTQATLVAPNNDAFDNLPGLVKFLADAAPQILLPVLGYHIIPAYAPASVIVGDRVGKKYPTLIPGLTIQKKQASPLLIGPPSGSLSGSSASVLQPNLLVDGQVAVHGISRVLIPFGLLQQMQRKAQKLGVVSTLPAQLQQQTEESKGLKVIGPGQ